MDGRTRSSVRGLEQEKQQLTVVIVGARGLRNADWSPFTDEKSDPYCICDIPGKREGQIRTRVIDNTLDPTWNHEAFITTWEPGDPLRFNVYDKDFGKRDDHLGTCTLLSSQFDHGGGFNGEVPLLEAGDGIRAYLNLRICFGKPMWGADTLQQAAMATASFTETQVTSMKTRRRNYRLGIGNVAQGPTRQQFRDFLRTERDRTVFCATLPFTIAMACVFCLGAYMHGNVRSVSKLRRGIYSTIEEVYVPRIFSDGTFTSDLTLGQVSNIGEMWDWIADGLIPKLGGDPDRPGFLSAFNKIIGKVQLRQRRVDMSPCDTIGADLAAYVRLNCRTDSAMRQSFGPEPDAGTNITQDVAFVSGGGLSNNVLGLADRYYAFLDVVPAVEGSLRARFLQHWNWCDQTTDWVEIHAALFNGEVRAFTHIIVKFQFEEGGLVGRSLDVRPMHIPEWSLSMLLVDCLWMLLVLVLFLVTVQEVIDRKGVGGGCARCCGDPWMVLDWCGTVVGVGIVLFFLLQWSGIQLLSQQIVELGAIELGSSPPWNATATAHAAYDEASRDYETSLATIVEGLRGAVELKSYHRIATFLYTFFILLRFFRGFLGQPYFASMGRTLAAAGQDLVHLTIMLGVAFENFVFSGCVFFGSGLKEWSTVNKAHRSALAFLSGLGDFASIYELYPVAATVWLFTFALAVIFVSSNMLIAIIVDHFGEVRADLGQGEQDIITQCRALLNDAVWTGSFHLRQIIRLIQAKLPKLKAVLPYLDDEPVRVARVPYEVILEALDPNCVDEAADPLAAIRNFDNLAQYHEHLTVPLWAKGQPLWAPMQRDVLIACGCDDSTADRLLSKCESIVEGKRPDNFPSDILYHEFEGQMRNAYEQLVATEDDLRMWLSERKIDCDNLEPRQRKLEALTVEKIMPRPQEDEPMLMPSSAQDDWDQYATEEDDDNDAGGDDNDAGGGLGETSELRQALGGPRALAPPGMITQ